MGSNAINFAKKSLTLITGASKGIGRAISLELSRRFEKNSTLVLIARSEQGLEETKSQIMEINRSINVYTYSIDLSKPNIDYFNAFFQTVTQTADSASLKYSMIIHNAGTTGALIQATNLSDLSHWQEHFNLNLFSTVLLNSAFIKHMRPVSSQLVCVNITAATSRIPYINMALYGSGKAARDMYFRVLALEEPDIIVLTYSPGPVDTDMFKGIIENAESEVLRKMFLEIKASNLVVTPVQTVTKLLHYLEKGNFKSGESKGYYDRFH